MKRAIQKLLIFTGFALLTIAATELVLQIAGVSYPNYDGKLRFYTSDEYTLQALLSYAQRSGGERG